MLLHAVYFHESIYSPLCACGSEPVKERQSTRAPSREPSGSEVLARPAQRSASRARRARTTQGRKKWGGASRLLGPNGLGEGSAGRMVAGGKSKRPVQGCLPRLSLLALPPALLCWESRPPGQVGPVPRIGKGCPWWVQWLGLPGRFIEALARDAG